MEVAGKIQKLDETVVNRIAAGEVIQRPANALKELIENSLDAKSTLILITVKDGGLKSLQIQDNGTGIRREDLDIVCERFTTSKLKTFDDLKSISTFGFRGEALASMSHVAHLTITTKTIDDKVAYRASYIDGKPKGPPKSLAGNQGTTILIENLFYNVATRRKALASPSEELTKISDVVTKYAVHNPTVSFTLKKQGEVIPVVRTPHDSTKVNNVKILFGNSTAKELIDVELDDAGLQFKMHALISNPNYAGKRLTCVLFINHRLVESASLKKMLDDLYSIYLPKKAHPWCYISLEINPENIDVNVHPTKCEVRFLHEDAIIERVKVALDEKLLVTATSRTFYVQARLPQVNVTKEMLEKVLPEYDKEKKVYAKEMIRTDAADQKLDRFNFIVKKREDGDTIKPNVPVECQSKEGQNTNSEKCDNKSTKSRKVDDFAKQSENFKEKMIACLNVTPKRKSVAPVVAQEFQNLSEKNSTSTEEFRTSVAECVGEISSVISDSAEKLAQNFSTGVTTENADVSMKMETDLDASGGYEKVDMRAEPDTIAAVEQNSALQHSLELAEQDQISTLEIQPENDAMPQISCETTSASPKFKFQSVTTVRRSIQLTSVLRLRKTVEDNYHEGLKKILSELIFVGCVDVELALIQSDVNLYICKTTKLAEELFYEIMLYDFANFGFIKFSDPLSLFELAMIGLDTEEAGWTEDDGPKEEIAKNVEELLMEKSEMLKEYFSIVIDAKGNLKSLPVLLEKYFPDQAELPLYILRLSTEVNWLAEEPCFNDICRETARFYSKINSNHLYHDWKYIIEHVLYGAIKESLLPPKHFSHDSTILQIASLPNLYKVFERC